MQSLKSRLIIYVMQHSHLFQLRLRKQTWDWDTSVPAFRAQCEAGAKGMKLAEGVTVSRVEIEGLTGINGRQAEWLVPANPMQGKAILYTAGGGYISGTCSDHRGFVSKIAAGSGVSTLLFDHRLAPEEPFPGALEDSVTAYCWLLDQGYLPSNIMIVGESAGGGLCLATLLAIRDQGYPLPAAAVAMSPWTDLALTGESYRTKVDKSIDPPGMSVVCSKYYVGDHDRRLPWISPLYGDIHGLPPLFICVGTNETMLDDSTRFADKARAAGVDVTLKIGEGMVHCYPLLAPLFPEATEAMQEICTFIQTHLSQSDHLDSHAVPLSSPAVV